MIKIFSKARWWARCIQQHKPEPFKYIYKDGSHLLARVKDDGLLEIEITVKGNSGARAGLVQEDAMKLAQWIIDNFGEELDELDETVT